MNDLDPTIHTSPFRLFLAVNRKEIPLSIIRVLFYAAGTLCVVGTAYYTGKVVDSVVTGSSSLNWFVTLLVASLIMHEVFYRTGHFFEVVVQSRIRRKIKKALFAHTAKLSFGYFADRFAGQISHQIGTAASAVERMEEIVVNKFIDNAWMVILSIITVWSVYPPLGIALALWMIVFCIGIRPFALKITAASERFASEESITTGDLVDTYTNVATVKAYSRDFGRSRIFYQFDKEARAQTSLGNWSLITYAYQGFSAVLMGLILFAVTAYGFRHGSVSTGGIVIVSGIVLKLVEQAYEVGYVVSDFVKSRGECIQALKDLVVVPSIADGLEVRDWKSVSIEYDRVSFGYNERNILKDFSLSVPEGQKLGIVGLSGAGKTTLVNLLLRFFEPQAGRISMSGLDISILNQDILRSHISFISQDTSLFHTSISDNIRYGSPDASDEDVRKAGKMAFAEEFVMQLPKGYETVVGERGVKLSGGQRQRIAIARAMLKNAPLFLLDEATSALDSDSEAKVQEALKSLMDGKTVIAIAHRLSTLQTMDRIVYLENGKILEDGTHDELLARGGRYATLWSMQAGGFIPDEAAL